MFDSLKKKLKEGVAKLSKGAEAPEEKPRTVEPIEKAPKPRTEEPGLEKKEPKRTESEIMIVKEAEEPAEHEELPGSPEKQEGPKEEKGGRLSRLLGMKEKVVSRELSDKDIDRFFDESELDLLQSDVAIEVADSLREKLKEKLVSSKVTRGGTGDFVRKAFEQSLLEIINQGRVDLESLIRKACKENKPLSIVFLGYNGSGKTTTLAKCANYIKSKGFRPVLAAGDTFRAASIEQLEVHGGRLGIKVIKHQYGSDAAAVIFDARKYAEKNGLDVVLADTAGRQHTDRNLMDELKKVVRVNSPDLKVLVVDSLTGNDAVEQASKFHEAVGVDCIVMTKTDVNPRGGSILSVVHTIGKPILFLGTGQEYKNIEMFDPRKFVKALME